MRKPSPYHKYIAAAFAVKVMISIPLGAAMAQTPRLDELFDRLSTQDLAGWQSIVEQIQTEWSRSGSPALDLLLRRGTDAIEAKAYDQAIAHLTALTDHAPDFAEGFNARATAYFLAGLYGPSLADIHRVLVLNPRHFGALTGLAIISNETGDPQTAYAAIRRAVALNPNDPDLQALLDRLKKQVRGVEL